MTSSLRPEDIRVGEIVRYRFREWVVLPSEREDLIRLRPIGGGDSETCGIYIPVFKELEGKLPGEKIERTQFPAPDPNQVLDHEAVKLFIDSARLLLRDGAVPFKSLGKISVQPRPYQYVPLIMALRIHPVRLLIADDVGIGKTIEALLIARELLDRHEIQRIGVLCPPYLVDQWVKEMREKFHLNAVAIRTSTLARLERECPSNMSIFQYYPYFVASIDLIKLERYRPNFLQHCPEFIIIDEAHGSARPPGGDRSVSKHLRYQLVQSIAENPNRHLVLLTATPHNGYDESFQSLLGFLKPEFASITLDEVQPDLLDKLRDHFVQRRRVDVNTDWDEKTPFPERESEEAPYKFSDEYEQFFKQVFRFATKIVQSGEALSKGRRKLRYWAALSLLRAVGSSPASALLALKHRLERGEGKLEPIESFADTEDSMISREVYDNPDLESATDIDPVTALQSMDASNEWTESERRTLREFIKTAEKIQKNWQTADTKILKCIEKVKELLEQGFNPVIWCRYVNTVHYVENRLKDTFHNNVRILGITGEFSDEERRQKIEELEIDEQRILVATDCLSEGINLQEYFNAVIHYDLPWNPNRLEQREGRVDRFGQPSEKVKSILLYGKDNWVDGAVLRVLIRKARSIHKQLGISIPLPESSEGILEAIFKYLFVEITKKAKKAVLPGFEEILFDEEMKKIMGNIDRTFEHAVERYRENRTRFAQRRIKPFEVMRLKEETEKVLGSPEDVLRFVRTLAQRLNFSFFNIDHKRPGYPDVYGINLEDLPPSIAGRIPHTNSKLFLTVHSPVPPKAQFLGRNHPLVSALAEYVISLSLHSDEPESSLIARCGVIRTRDVALWTGIFVFRIRYRLRTKDSREYFSEEVLPVGVERKETLVLLDKNRTYELLDTALPTANVPQDEKKRVIHNAIEFYRTHKTFFLDIFDQRQHTLMESHRKLREQAKLAQPLIRWVAPPDLLALLVLLPHSGTQANEVFR